jgi:hypothetical protein
LLIDFGIAGMTLSVRIYGKQREGKKMTAMAFADTSVEFESRPIDAGDVALFTIYARPETTKAPISVPFTTAANEAFEYEITWEDAEWQ